MTCVKLSGTASLWTFLHHGGEGGGRISRAKDQANAAFDAFRFPNNKNKNTRRGMHLLHSQQIPRDEVKKVRRCFVGESKHNTAPLFL